MNIATRITAWLIVWLCAAPCVADDALVAHWTFAEGSGDVLHDQSGHGNHGAIHGATWVKVGRGYALRFDGEDDFVDCGNDDSLNPAEHITLMAWVWLDPQKKPGEPGIIGKAYTSYVITQYYDRVYGYIGTGGQSVNDTSPKSRWLHIAQTFDGEALHLYLDGRDVAVRNVQSPIPAGEHFWMGRSDGVERFTRNAHFAGMISEVRVYNRAISAAEIREHERTSHPAQSVTVAAQPVETTNQTFVQLDKRTLAAPAATVNALVELIDTTGQVVDRRTVHSWPTGDITSLDLSMADQPAGTYRVRCTASDARGEPLGLANEVTFDWEPIAPFPRGKAGAKQLNNLVTELLNVDTGQAMQQFINPRDGWIFIAAADTDHVQLYRADDSDTIELIDHEAMRRLPAGSYGIRGDGRLVVRAIPSLVYSRYNANPHTTPFGPYAGAMQDRYVAPNVNVFVGAADAPFAKVWRDRGRAWLAHTHVVTGTEEQPLTVDAAYDFIATNPLMQLDNVTGLIADEYSDSEPRCSIWAPAIDRMLSEPRFAGKWFVPYVNDMWNGPDGIEMIRAINAHGSPAAWKRYMKEQRTEVQAWQFLAEKFIAPAMLYRRSVVDDLGNLIVTFGTFSAPPEQLDTFPHVDYRSYIDMQMHLVATHPAFDGTGGIMTYLSSYTDEEIIRLGGRLFRHYGIEGRTDRFITDPYMLPHIANGDFDREGEGWTLNAAEPGAIKFGRFPGFGWLQGRYPQTTEGDTVLITRRSSEKPNTFSQTIRELEPGRLYSLRLYAADYNDMHAEQLVNVSIDVDGVTMIEDRCFTHLSKSCYGHHVASYDTEHPAWMNFHYKIFRADRPTATLTVSDWKNASDPGGLVGRELMFNFIQVQPFLEP